MAGSIIRRPSGVFGRQMVGQNLTDGGVTGVGAVGAAAGVATVLAIGASLVVAVGAAGGTSTATGVGAALYKGVGEAAGSSTAIAFSVGGSVGNAAGTSTATGIGSSNAGSVGSSDGVGAAAAVGRADSRTTGSAAGLGNATATAGTPGMAGSAAGTSTATAIGKSNASSVGNAAGTSTASGVSGNPALTSGSALLANINLTETYQEHFDNHSWASPQAQINAGYPIVIEPVPTTGTYIERIDWGLLLSNLVVTITYNQNQVSGTTTTLIEMQVSTDDSTYSSYTPGVTQFFPSFRYLRFKLTFTGSDDKSILVISNLTIRLDVKREQDGGVVTAISTDGSGTAVLFNKAFKDIDAITATPMGTVERKVVIDFSDVPNPTGFSVYLFNSAGARVTGDVRWIARGVL